MLTIDQLAAADSVATETLELPFELRCKSRLRTQLASGEECGLFLPRGVVLRGGDKLVASDGRIIAVVAATETLMEAQGAEPLHIASAAYHLGNRHVAVHLMPGKLRFVADHVLGEMVRRLGLQVVVVEVPFEPASGAYGSHGGHGRAHEHGSDGEGHGPRIHDHFHHN